ncbi:MAG: UDP-N-acetylglucosamine--N-acetylmuramyl-(pentapeptide) pyrophosphoryl-undecaprenol N-acetylglucosamine transferase [Parvularculaceae bacterium]|nr:UDP-N-acetylglucosamine--N-acetylmuramyl-(pentapeptide) pyrophosphoryl-undecaprenol N-acetylglucosamine transferase [Parvularculaceae bacterium]
MSRDDDRLIVLAAGGTGGHLFPAEALAQELKRRGWRIMLVTDERGARYATSFPADERLMISAASPSIGGPIAKIAAAFALAGGLFSVLREFIKRDVAAAVGFGGYPSFPSMMAASLLRIPYGVHEQNGVLGRANRMVAQGASFLAHGFSVIEKAPQHIKGALVEVGNPVRDAVGAVAAKDYPPIDSESKIDVLIFGGSQGASLFSFVTPQAIAGLPVALRERLRIVQQVRDPEISGVRKIYSDAGVDAELAPFFNDLPARIASAHLVIARAGASTVTELSIIGRPSILVPLAIAMDDHQTGNARALADSGGAVRIAEADFTPEALQARLHDLLTDTALLRHMASAAKGRVKSNAAGALADLVENIAVEKSKSPHE